MNSENSCGNSVVCVRDLYETIESENLPDGIDEREWRKLDSKAVAMIRH